MTSHRYFYAVEVFIIVLSTAPALVHYPTCIQVLSIINFRGHVFDPEHQIFALRDSVDIQFHPLKSPLPKKFSDEW